jgi:tetratricopeptide (TPR) repeat protein/transcriptional regulator with XRE-family HTH domain
MPDVDFGSLLRRYRQRALLTQEDLATRTGLSARTIRRLETNQLRRPRTATIRALAGQLGLESTEQAELEAAPDVETVNGSKPDVASAVGDPRVAADPAATAPPRAAQLPADVAAFTGRVEHLNRLDALLAGVDAGPPAVVISAIAGTAGVGKTALAVHWAHRVRDRFPDGQLYVNLQGFAPNPPLRPIDALTQFLHALGARHGQVPVDQDEAASMYRSLLADKRILVLLDNAASAEQIRSLLPGSPGCLVLITSRLRLSGLVARDGAQRIDLGHLSADEAEALLARIVDPERVRAEPGVCAELARACAYLPLALRIAAANIADRPQRTIAEYLAQLTAGDWLSALSIVDDDQAAVRGTFDLSYQQLAGDAQHAFRLLGLVPGSDITADAASALIGTDLEQTSLTLDRLAAGHLLDQKTPGRYSFHDLLLRYASERAHADEPQADRAAAVDRLVRWYLRTAADAVRLLYPGKVLLPSDPANVANSLVVANPEQALAWLDAERANLVATARLCAEHGPRPVAWLLADTLRGYFAAHMHSVEWLATARAAAAAAAAADDLTGQAVAQLNLADVLRRLSQYQQAIDHYQRALALSREVGWLDGEATALANLSGAYLFLGRLPDGADHLKQALRIDRQTGRQAGQASRLNNLGVVYWQMGELRQAATYYREALSLYPGNDSLGEANGLSNISEVYHALGRFDLALDHVSRAIGLYRRLLDYGDPDALRIMASIQRDSGQYQDALDPARAAIALSRGANHDPRTEAHALVTLGTIRQCLGQYGMALQLHRRALRLAVETGNRFPQTEALIGLALAHLKRDEPEEAMEHARTAFAIARDTGYRLFAGQALTVLAEISLHRRRIADAVDQAQRALAIHRETGHRLGEANALLVLGQALGTSCDVDAATSCWRQALKIFEEVGAPAPGHARIVLSPSTVANLSRPM